ncbi:MAG: NUDIX hydrolase [Candidatus Eiseniibacteriota bacterium]
MYVGEDAVREAERRFGLPAEATFHVDTPAAEIAFIRRTQKHGRAHDVTILIRDGARIAAIAKHHYPPGIFRLPSGAIDPGESIEDGARREACEETGLDVTLTRYLLRSRVRFAAPEPADSIDWTTHVLEARATGGALGPLDLVEIREAAWVTREDLLGPIRDRLVAWKEGGIQYRWQLHDAIFAEVDRRGGADTRG